jgi:enamidase
MLAEEGVDFIKIVSDSLRDRVPIKAAVVKAIIDQAHQEGLKAVGHVDSDEDVEKFSQWEMDGFVHPPQEPSSRHNPQRLSQVLAERKTPVTTTLSIHLDQINSTTKGKAPQNSEVALRSEHIAVLANAGVPIVVGTDWNPSGMGHPAAEGGTAMNIEMKMLRWGGMSREDIIQAATANAAEALEMGSQVGTVEEGKLADLIVVDGNPLEDLGTLKNVETVIKDGEIVVGNGK